MHWTQHSTDFARFIPSKWAALRLERRPFYMSVKFEGQRFRRSGRRRRGKRRTSPAPAPVRGPRCLFAEIALHAKLVQLRFCRFHLCEVAPRQHDHGRFPSSLQIAFSHAAVTACHDRNCVILPDPDMAQAAPDGPPVLCYLYFLRSTSSRRRI